MRDDLVLAVIVAAVGFASCLDCTGDRVASAQSREPAAVTLTRDALDVARMLCGEADGSAADHGAILWTMHRRARAHGMSMAAMARAYSAPLRGYGGARGRWVRALPVLPTPGYARTWGACVDAVRAFAAGELADPCRGPSTHFGSRRDVATRWPDVALSDCGATRNVYFAEVR